jgi:hypothetical protein
VNDLAELLRRAIAEEEPLLRAIGDEAAGAARDGRQWSRKQELGHLLDSAVNNRVRFVRAALDGRFEGPSYDAEGWVELGGYGGMRWAELVDLWKASNAALAALIARIPEERRKAECRIGGGAPVTLEFVVDDYIQHMLHHVDAILSRAVRSYPGAKK